jgi:mannose/fructose/N-acetylgalactosamine-specific phosphotransferase system component IID
MKTNMGSTDRIIRLIVAAILATLYFTGNVTGTLGIILVVVAAVFTLTSFVSFCPLYAIFGMNTCPVKDK